MSAQPLILIGASTRAAAQSARRAGFEPFCVDQFADEDLRACATLLPCERYPEDLPATLATAPQAEWLYTGGLENQPDLVEELATIRPLLGNRASALRRVRDPFWVAELLQAHQRPTLEVRSLPQAAGTQPTGTTDFQSVAPIDGLEVRRTNEGSNSPADERIGRRWLCKPLRSAGGKGITEFDSTSHVINTEHDATHYLQEFAPGIPISGLFVTDGQHTLCCGLSRQLIAEPISNAPPFGYAGSIAPLDERDLPATAFEQVASLGTLIAQHAELRGLFGIDCIWDTECGVVWLLEVNPRYTASVELYEQATGVSLLARHRAACIGTTASDWLAALPRTSTRCGKLILYAATDLTAPDLREHSGIADIPTPGSTIPAGVPVCSVLANGPTTAECLAKLRKAAASHAATLSPFAPRL